MTTFKAAHPELRVEMPERMAYDGFAQLLRRTKLFVSPWGCVFVGLTCCSTHFVEHGQGHALKSNISRLDFSMLCCRPTLPTIVKQRVGAVLMSTCCLTSWQWLSFALAQCAVCPLLPVPPVRLHALR